MGSKGGGNKEAERARKEEQERQERIRSGTQSINSIFNGGLVTGEALKPTGGAVDFGAGEYYDASGNRMSGKVTAWDNETAYGAPRQVQGQFNDDHFKRVRDSFTGYAMPQLQEQRGKAEKELTFSLDRSGLLDSSVRGEKASGLQKLYDLNEQQIKDQAVSYENEARNSVEGARSDLVSMLNATGDNVGAANSALTRASLLTQPQAYSPIGQMFSDFTAGLGTQAALERSHAAGGPAPRYNTGLFGNTGRVTVRQ